MTHAVMASSAAALLVYPDSALSAFVLIDRELLRGVERSRRALDESAVAVVVSAGVMGKTTLAAAVARRFGWRFRRVAG